MRKSLLMSVAAFGLMAVASPAIADDHMEKAEVERQNVDWYRINLTKFHEGKRSRAQEILDNYFMKAMEGNEIKPKEIHVNFGDYDVIMMWPMPGGTDMISWQNNPYFAKAWGKLQELAGGLEEAQALVAEFDSLIKDEHEMLAHIDKD